MRLSGIHVFALAVIGFAVKSGAADQPNDNQQKYSSPVGGQSVLRLGVDSVPAFPIPADTPVLRWAPNGGAPIHRGTAGTVVYRNDQAVVYLPVGANVLLADDVETMAAGGGPMTSLEIQVFSALNPSDPVYRVTHLAMYDRCPGAGGTVIFDFLNGQPIDLSPRGVIHVLSFEFPDGMEIPIPERFWLGLRLDDGSAGWVGGARPALGHSENLVHVPSFPCRAVIAGNPPPYSAMTAEVSVLNPTPYFRAYQARTLTQPTPLFDGGDGCLPGVPGLDGCGDGVNVLHGCEAYADDLGLIVPSCTLHTVVLHAAGVDGLGTQIEMELWTDAAGLPGVPIAGTRGCSTLASDGFMKRLFFDFPEAPSIPQSVWLVLMDGSANAGPVLVGSPPEIGFSSNSIAFFSPDLNAWIPVFFKGNCPVNGGIACGTYYAELRCLGEDPFGACCDRGSGLCLENRTFTDCNGRFAPGMSCAAAGFDPPCGHMACCRVHPTNPLQTVCANEPVGECLAGGEPFVGSFCEGVDCGLAACIAAQVDCLSEHGGAGCRDRACCNAVCEVDPFCCEVEWDGFCVKAASDFCSAPVPLNDLCFEASPASLGNHPFTTVGAGTDGPPLPTECGASGVQQVPADVWYRFVPDFSGWVEISTCQSTTFDTLIAVYRGCGCPPAEFLACDDDGCGGTSLQ